tara:strand:+ start:333 stop:551 length:219 start_codon:yes stop_codon:yes gene_type:complete
MNRECIEKCECCIKKNRIINKLQSQIDKLQRNSDSWAKAHWDMVGENCKLRDKLGVLSECDNEIIKGILNKS